MPGVVHLACSSVAALLHDAPAPGQWLTVPERERLAGFAGEQRRTQFTAARWLARWLLAQAFGGGPADWPLTVVADAPPGVAGRPDLHLAVSHSGGHAACALGWEPVGLDLEAPGRPRDVEGLIALCCTAGEQALLAQAADRVALFHELWTVKEAWLKRRREWIAPARLQQLECTPGADGEVRTFDAGAWRAAVAAPGAALRWWTPQPDSTGTWRVVAAR